MIYPLTIPITEEQEKLYGDLREMFERAKQIANDETVELKFRLEAIRLVGYIGQVIGGILKDVRMDEIQKQLLEIEEEIKKSRAGGGKRGKPPIYTS
jgi:hypothetical protein